MEWRLARPKEFEKMAKEEQLCIVPLACLERHGEHMPFGTDGIIAEKIAVEAAKREPCMVFPTIYFGGEIHEATCFSGAVAFSNELCFRMWDSICSEIARNGFKKILIVNGHGCFTEKGWLYALRPDLVRLDLMNKKNGTSTHRFDEFAKNGIYTPFAWMANYPDSLTADYHEGMNERIAKVMLDRLVEQLASAFKFLKEETISEAYYEEWAAKNPLI